jgi:hypothetical protein
MVSSYAGLPKQKSLAQQAHHPRRPADWLAKVGNFASRNQLTKLMADGEVQQRLPSVPPERCCARRHGCPPWLLGGRAPSYDRLVKNSTSPTAISFLTTGGLHATIMQRPSGSGRKDDLRLARSMSMDGMLIQASDDAAWPRADEPCQVCAPLTALGIKPDAKHGCNWLWPNRGVV